MPGALSGVRVLDLTRAVAGAFGSMLLGDMGAEINKVENVPADEPPVMNIEDIKPTEEVAHFWGLNRNKKGICLDLTKPAAKEVFFDLAKKSDVVYDNFRPGVLNKLGIDYDSVKKVNPKIISCSISGYGENGPLKSQPSYDVIVQAISGLMTLRSEPGRMPPQTGMPFGDLGGGLFSAFGVVCALYNRKLTGEGQRIETSIFDSLLALISYRVPQVFGAGMKFDRLSKRSGAGQVPYGLFKAGGGSWIAIAAGPPAFWESLCKAIGRDDFIKDPRFNTLEKRQEHEDEVSQVLEEAMLAKTAEEWEEILVDAGVPAGRVRNVEEAFTQPQAQARNMLVSFDHPFGKKLKFAGNPLKMSASRVEKLQPAPGIGEHTREVLSGLLGYSEERISRLKKEKAIWYPDRGITYGAGAMARF